MKKFLCVLLTLAMLLTSMVFVVSAAEETSDTEVVWLNDCDTTAGNKGIANYTKIDEEEKTQGKGSIATAHAKGTYGPGGFMWQFGFDVPADVSNASYFCFDFYCNRPEVLSGNMQLELTSSGGPDVEEGMFPGITLKEGWNTIELPLAAFPGGCDFTRFNFMRLFNAVNVTAEKKVQCKIDNIRFETRGDKISFNPFTENDSYFLAADGAVGTQDWGKFADENGKIIYAFEIPSEKVPYMNNVKVALTVHGNQPEVLASADGVNWKSVFSANDAGGAKFVFADVTSAIDFNKSNYLYIAIGDSVKPGGNGGQLHKSTLFEVIFSETDVQARSDAEYYSFRANTASEDAYCIQKEGKVHDSQPYRYHDNGAKSVWKYVLADATELQAINYTVRMAANGSKGGLLLQVSLDNKEWTDIYVGGADSNTPYTFNLMKFIDVEALQAADVPTIYIRMGDATPENGWGGQIWSNVYTTLAVVHTPPPATGIVGMVDRIFTEFKILSKIPFLSRLFKSAKPVA